MGSDVITNDGDYKITNGQLSQSKMTTQLEVPGVTADTVYTCTFDVKELKVFF